LSALGDAYLEQWDELRVWCDRLSDEEWLAPSVLAAWRVADLVAHLELVAASVITAAEEPTAVKGLTIADYLARYGEVAASIDARTRDRGARGRSDILCSLDQLGEAAAQVFASLRMADDPVVTARRGPIKWSSFVATRCIELTVHADDLSRSVSGGRGPQLKKACLNASARALTRVLAERSPGHSVEVRVPPVAAVQCVPGPRHTRGTPSAVVELDPISFVRLAAGRISWLAAVDQGMVTASGQRADLTEWLPLFS